MDSLSPIMEISTVVPFGAKISVISVPSCPLIGVERGNKSSSVALMIVSNKNSKTVKREYTRLSCDTGG